MAYINHYRCPGNLDYRQQHEPEDWTDESESMNNDKCPTCNAETEPYESENEFDQ